MRCMRWVGSIGGICDSWIPHGSNPLINDVLFIRDDISSDEMR
jgi:hypothetical protein